MSYRNSFEDRFEDRDVDVTVAKLGLVVAVLLLGLRFFADQPFITVIPVAVGLACGTYLATHDRVMDEVALPQFSETIAGYLPAVVVLAVAALVAAVRLVGERSLPVLLLTGLVGSLLLFQILLVRAESLSPPVVLVEIFVAAVVIRTTALFAVPGFVGGDIWVHGPVWVDGIAATGSLDPLSESKYLLAPLYHVLASLGALVTGSARAGIYLTVGLVVPLSALFVYGIGAMFVPARWALAATALYAFADQFIRWGLHVIPTSLGLAFFIPVLYFVLKTFYTDGESWVAVGVFAFSLAVVFTHQVSTAVLLVTLAVAVGVAIVRDATGESGWQRSTLVLGGTFLASLVATAVSWTLAPWRGGGADTAGDGFLVRMLGIIQETFVEDAGFLNLISTSEPAVPGAGGSETFMDAVLPYVELFGFALLLAGAVVGALVMLRWRQRMDATLTVLVAGAVMFLFTFGFNTFGITVFMPGRWIAFLYVPLSLVAAVGLFHVVSHAPRGAMVAIVLVLALGYPTSMVMAEKATLDDPAFDDRHVRTSFTDAELAASQTIPGLLSAGTMADVQTDHPYWRAFHPQKPVEMATLVVDADGPVADVPVVYRSYQTTGPSTFQYQLGEAPYPSTDASYAQSEVCSDGRNHVYANDEVLLCTSPGDSEVSE
ncbi:hypothetical protein [Halorubellus sp. PRR65]|uniref:hypothetical protein n=1 Tax=Halorubellus sp. PRR65 TaxID=3098148 RepID=UPI002B26222B|nr:hypothetical protein [Halorubellus sp. PRR65]